MVTVMGPFGRTSRCNRNGGRGSGLAAVNVLITKGSDRNGQVHGVANAHAGSDGCKDGVRTEESCEVIAQASTAEPFSASGTLERSPRCPRAGASLSRPW